MKNEDHRSHWLSVYWIVEIDQDLQHGTTRFAAQ